MSYELPEFPPKDFAPPDWDDAGGGMQASAMAVVATMAFCLGLGLGFLVWGW